MRHRRGGGGPPDRQDLIPPPVESIQKTLTRLLSTSGNRSCADCRSLLVDVSQVYASVSPPPESDAAAIVRSSLPRYNNFRFNHRSFAPPGETEIQNGASRNRGATSSSAHPYHHHQHQQQQQLYPLHSIPDVYDPPVDPALVAHQRVGGGGHGVFVCALCGAAHKLLGTSVAVVHPVQDLASWTRSEAQVLDTSGGNERSWSVFEAYLPPSWEHRRPKAESDIADRLTFIRAKYEALAFVLPPPGPLAFRAWRRIVNLHPEWSGLWGADLHSVSCSSIFQAHPSSSSQTQLRRSTLQTLSTTGDASSRRSELPDRLVDYFCVVTASEMVDLSTGVQDASSLTSPEDVVLVPQVTDCFPLPDTHGRDQEFPEHVSTFLFPDGCRASCMSLPPSFFTFVLTASNGDRLYGGVLRLYDESRDVDFLKGAFHNSGYKGSLPDWLRTGNRHGSSRSSQSSQVASDIVFLPKCLVVISHYPFFDLWRKFLLQIYRIALVGAPLPIERFIANFTCEIPLPPPGKIRVKFGFTIKDNWCIERPPENQLPLADFSFRPLFTALSIPNVLIVFACLLQECRVALVCKHYGILGPVAEALTSLLFPLHWEGMYIPVLPYHMLDILDAPVPYLVGLHSRYLQSTPPSKRPTGVVFVDLDRDEVHLGYDDETNAPRQIPSLPERQALKLKAKLEEFAACAYVVPPSGNVATVTVGDGEQPSFVKRTSHLNLTAPESRSSLGGGLRRRDVFSSADKAYRDNELQVPITGFLSEHGQFFEQLPSTPTGTISKSKFPRFRALGLTRSSSFDSSESAEHANINLLDRQDPPGFSSAEVRGAFLRFFVSLLLDYRQHLGKDAFRADDFIASLPLTAASTVFVHRFLKTQMFDRFIAERRENPFDPEVKFFDESIAAKIKRSKRTALANIGRHAKMGTAFLEDSSKLVTETYTPPPPSNWGLPDDGRVYSYGTFPSLQSDLFGKVRPPRTWRGRRSSLRMSRRSSVRTAASEQVVFAKAMVPAMRSTSTLLAVTKRGAKNLEQAIAALSNQFTSATFNSSNHSQGSPDRLSVISEVTVPSELGMVEDIVTSAEEVVLNHRRKQAILLGIFMTLQGACRTRYSKRQSVKKSTVTDIQFTSSDSESMQFAKEYFAAATIQSCARGAQVRHVYRRARRGTSLLQAATRGRTCRFAYGLVRTAIVKVQGSCRGFLTRRRMSAVVSGRLVLYRQYLVELWKSTNTSLCYRSVFWSCIRKDRILQLSFAEDEIRRLWVELGTEPPSFPASLDDPMMKDDARLRVYINLKLNPTKLQESVLKAAAKLGVTNRMYTQTLLLLKQGIAVQNPISSYRSSIKPGSINGSAKQNGSLREVAERIQVYDKLCASSLFAHEDRLFEFFNRFKVPLKEKRKKVTLSEILWTDPSFADESSRLMMELFPELKEYSDIHFREPSKKTRGRFKASGYRPDPLEPRMRVHVLFRERVRRNVREVADASLRQVPALLLRLAPLIEKQRLERSESNRLLYLRASAFNTQAPTDLRINLMRTFVQPPTRTTNLSSDRAEGPKSPPRANRIVTAAGGKPLAHMVRPEAASNIGTQKAMLPHTFGPAKDTPHFDLSTIRESSPPAFAASLRSGSTVLTGQTSLRVQS